MINGSHIHRARRLVAAGGLTAVLSIVSVAPSAAQAPPQTAPPANPGASASGIENANNNEQQTR